MDQPIRQIFLSYSRPDQDQAEQIARRLDQEGHPVWYDHAKIVPGESWSDALDRGLRESSHCLVIVGPGKVRPWQREEIRTAINRAVIETDGFRLIPVLIPGASGRPGESELPSFLTNRQWVEFRDSLDDETTWRRLICGLEGREPGFDPATGQSGQCPYKGIAVFDIEDARYFYGREAITDKILARLRKRITQAGRPRFFAIIGPSGTGKSSLARAGILAGIKRGALDDCAQWAWPPLIFKPGEAPLTALAKALIAHQVTGPRFAQWSVADVEANLRSSVNSEHRFLGDEIDTVVPADTYLPVLVDQFEELLKPFAIQDSGEQQEIDAYKRDQFLPFVHNLVYAARQPSGRLVFIVTMRDDFYGRCSNDPLLRALVSENHDLIAPLSESELRDAVEYPARNAGKAVQPALLTLIEKDMRNRPGALPLLQETLEQMWGISGNTLVSDAYNKLGGIEGSLEKKADETFRSLIRKPGLTREQHHHREELIRQIFLDLVNRDGGTASSRRRELQELPADPDTGSVLEAFVDARLLLKSGGDVQSGRSYYELTHEALIEHWSRLKGWLTTEREDARFRLQLEQEAERWARESEQHKTGLEEWKKLEPEYLLTGKRWHRARQWRDGSKVPPSGMAIKYLDRCQDYSNQRRKAGRKKGILAVVVLIMVLLAGWFGYTHLISTRLNLIVQDTEDKAIGDYELHVSKERSLLDENQKMWASLIYLEPDAQYWLRVSGKGYYLHEREYETKHAGEVSDIEVRLLPTALIRPKMIFIPGDEFVMGSEPATDSDAYEEKQPTRRVKVKDFYIGKYEVTFDEYDQYAKAKGLELPDDSGFGRGNRPVINVSWEDAAGYAEWLSSETGKHYRLPTEAEWKYAARAKSKTRYWWGDQIKQDGRVWANCDGCGSQWDDKETAPAGQFPANGFGLHDTAGNVWEWTQDCWHDSYEGNSRPDDGSAWEAADGSDCGRRVIRGGSWVNLPRGLRSAYRFWFIADVRFNYLGFRLAQDVEE